MQCILYKIYFWKVFHMNYNWICTPICTKNFILAKSGCYIREVMWFVMLESTKDRVLGVDTPGQ
jgi:hypothetical protein